MEWLVGFHPLAVSDLVACLYATFAGLVAVEFAFQSLKPFLEFQLVWGGHRTVAFSLELAELVERLLEIGGFDSDLFHRIVEVKRASDGAFDFVVGRVTHERIAGADVEINIWEWLDAEVVARGVRRDLGSEL